jgi:hypothetical protein
MGMYLQGFNGVHSSLLESNLKSIYTIHWWGGMLGTAGKDGRINLFKIPLNSQVCAQPAQIVGVIPRCRMCPLSLRDTTVHLETL